MSSEIPALRRIVEGEYSAGDNFAASLIFPRPSRFDQAWPFLLQHELPSSDTCKTLFSRNESPFGQKPRDFFPAAEVAFSIKTRYPLPATTSMPKARGVGWSALVYSKRVVKPLRVSMGAVFSSEFRAWICERFASRLASGGGK